MIWFLIFSAGLWFLGSRMNAPVSARWTMIGLLYVAILSALVIVPSEASLHRMLGGSPGEWLVLGLLAVAVWAYSRGLRRVKARARTRQEPKQATGTFQQVELERYARHIVLREIGGPGQKKLKQARVLVIGAGGLGSPALQYLAAAGVGTIGVIDHDMVDNSNLQRQVIHTDDSIGMPKVFSAERAMTALNPYVQVRPYHRKLTEDIAADLFGDYDLILDGTDSFDARYLANRTAARLGKPLIGAALSQWEGQISLYDPARGTPCYQCIFPEAPAPGLAPTCAEAGVLSPLPGVVGAMMAVEAIKHLAGAGEGLRGRMLIYDALFCDTRIISLKRRPDCPVCGG